MSPNHARLIRPTLLTRLTVLISLTAILSGCGETQTADDSTSQTSSMETQSAGEESGTEAASADSIELTPIDQAGLNALISEQAGNVVLVDFWATWCGPCIEKLPDVAKLDDRYREQGLQVYSVCIGNHTDEKAVASMQRQLARANANFEHLVSNHQKDQAAFNDFDLAQVPHYRLYKRDGTLFGKYDGKPDDLEAMIQSLLNDE